MTVEPELLARLAAEYGTPCYVYDLAELRRAHADLTATVPPDSRIFYSLKANPHPPLVRELLAARADAEVCSTRELDTALAMGADAASCLYTGPGKTDAEFTHALSVGVRMFSVDSPTDLRRLAACARRVGIATKAILRLNPTDYPRNAGLAMGGTPSQFGADVTWVCREPDAFSADGVELVGYHVYVGTNVTTVEELLTWFEIGVDAVLAAQAALRLPVELVDLGGGFGSPFTRAGTRPELRGLAAPLGELLHRKLFTALGYRPTIAFESGRFLAGAAGCLVLSVQDVKASKGTRFVVADGGINVLGGMSGLRRVPPIVPHVIALSHNGSAPDAPTVLAGPLCTALDLLNNRATLPALSPGDLLVVPNVGAYGFTASLLAFLSRDAPAEITVDGTEVRSAQRLRFTYAELPVAVPS
jgi:diaminopimelate decarboxylase